MIPLVDLKAQYSHLENEILDRVKEVFKSTHFIQGPFVEEFEDQFVKMHAASFGAGVSNGTAAISLALEALGVGRGDEVIVPTHTFFATAEAVCNVGATPVFADILPSTYCLDPEDVLRKISSKTKALIPVHIYGNPVDLNALAEIARGHALYMIEDSAQAHFAKYKGQYIGSFGDAATFSFYPGKNLGAFGDAGFVFCKDEQVFQRVKKLRDHGRSDKYEHDLVGSNQRMDAVQAAVLSVKLRYILEWTKSRQEKAMLYDEAIRRAGFKTIEPTPSSEPVYHLYVVEVSNREEVMVRLKEKGISTGIHYPIPLHKQPAFKGMDQGCFRVAEKVAERVISLPLCPELTVENVNFITAEFLKVARP